MKLYQTKTEIWGENLMSLMNILFALTIEGCLVENIKALDFIGSYTKIPLFFSETTLTVFLVFILIVLSWVGYYQSITLFPYKTSRTKTDRLCYIRAFFDILILTTYVFMVFHTDNLSQILWAITIVYFLYFFSGVTRIIEWNDRRASKWYLSLGAAGFSLLLFIAAETGFLSDLNIIWISIVTVILFRVIRQFLGYSVKYIIGVDIDGTLAEQVGAAIKHYQNKGMAEKLQIEDVDDWNFKINGENIAEFFEKQFINNPEFALTIEPIEGAIEAMKQLAKSFRLVIITSRPKESKESTKKWLKENNIPFHELRHTETGEKFKIGFHYLIDDYHNEARRAARKNIPTLLFSRSYNQNIEKDKRFEELFFDKLIIRNNSWSDVVENIYRISETPYPIKDSILKRIWNKLKNVEQI